MKMQINPRSLSRGLLLIGFLISSGCLNSQPGSVSANESNSELQDSAAASYEKILIDEAVLEDIAAHKAECASKSSKKQQICIQICHVPPGNHEAAHSKILPLQSIKAHLGHGDYLGLCGDGDNSGEEPGGEDPSEEVPPDEVPPGEEEPGIEEPAPEPSPSPSPSPSPTASPGGEEPEIPLWCAPYQSVDLDCDGYIDETGEPYL